MNKKLKKALLFILMLIVLLTAGFVIYASDYYHAEDVSMPVASSGSRFKYIDGGSIALQPSYDTDTGIIFYPGAKVEYTSYLPLMEKLKSEGYTCVLIKMPFNFAFFDKSAADRVYDEFPNIKHWYIGGHSLGGAMASSYASKNMDKVDGVILLGAYIYGDVSKDKSVTIYGSEDGCLNKSKIDYTENVRVIEGGNHAQFGNYGSQKGDGEASISRDEQQDIAVMEIKKFINSNL